MYRHYSELKKAIASGVVDDTKAVGVLDQWLIEGKYTEEEALVLSCDLLAAGMDTVSIILLYSGGMLLAQGFKVSGRYNIERVAVL